MRITHKTPIADAAKLMVERDGDNSETVCRKRAETGNSKSQAMWTAIADTISGNPPADVHVDGDWTLVKPGGQWGHVSNRAAIYQTSTGYEWEVFGVTRGMDVPSLDQAKQEAEKCIQNTKS